MRFVLILLVVLGVVAKPASACLGPFAEKSIFLKSLPASMPKSEALLEGRLTSVGAKKIVKILKVIKDSTGSLRLKKQIGLDYFDTSCGPYHRVGDSGIIRVKITGKGNQTKISPYLYPRI